MTPVLDETFFATERRLFWRSANDMRAALRDGDAPNIVDECLDELESVYLNTDQPLLRKRAGELLVTHRPAAYALTAS